MTMVIVNAQVMPMDRPALEHGFVRVENGRIAELGSMPYTGGDTEFFDAQGGTLLPGFVDAHTHMGICEDSLGFEGDDCNEETDPSTPQLRAVDAINVLDRCFSEALAAGVTTVITGPGSANPIGGQLCAMKTYGRTLDSMLVKAPVAMKMALGENPKTVYHGKQQTPVTRMATASIIREQLERARRYDRAKTKAQKDPAADEPEFNMKCEALVPVIRGQLPVHFHAHRLDDIFTAKRIAKEFGLDYVIVHGTQAHMAAQELADDHTRVLCGPLLCDRCKPELKELTPAGPGILNRAGVEVSIVTDHPVIPEQYLPLCAGLAMREGLDYEQALAAITINPARICHIDDRVGSITPGKDADLVLFGGDPLTVAAKPTAVFAGGKRVI